MRTPISSWLARRIVLALSIAVVLGACFSKGAQSGERERGPCGESIDRTPVPSSWERIGVIETTTHTSRRSGRICIWKVDTVRYREVKNGHTSWHRKVEYTLVSVSSREAKPDEKRLEGGIETNVTNREQLLDWLPKAVDWVIGHVPDGTKRLNEAVSFTNEMRKAAEHGLQETGKISEELAPKTPLDVFLTAIPFEKGIALAGNAGTIFEKLLATSGKLKGIVQSATEKIAAIRTTLANAVERFAQGLAKIWPKSTYPGRRSLPPGATVPLGLPTSEMVSGSRRALDDLPKGHLDTNGVWDQAVLQQNTKLSQGLDDFAAGRIGSSVKDVDLSNKSAEEIHDLLMKKGFKHQRKPLEAGRDANGRQLYKRRDGSRTLDPKDPEIVPHDIYTHGDGGLVRVKPEGDPGNPFRPTAHVSKSVLYDARKGTGWENEAFKVTNNDLAVPKAPDRASGMSQGPGGLVSPQEIKGYHDTVMGQAHTNLP